MYVLYLNGSRYGFGNLQYINELITDYISKDLYGREEVSFKIEKAPQLRNFKIQKSTGT